MSQMIYKRGGDTLVWGLKAHVKVIEADELEAHLAEGWLDHPSKLFEPARKQRKGKIPSENADEFV
ncbi:hypothetical protein [Serratia marcescens]|uniref:hypothetical protein n=1 Tax=Serratia marcescens TaxID=615 RepID=UPI00332BFD3A